MHQENLVLLSLTTKFASGEEMLKLSLFGTNYLWPDER